MIADSPYFFAMGKRWIAEWDVINHVNPFHSWLVVWNMNFIVTFSWEE
jgi:hypothetical protein